MIRVAEQSGFHVFGITEHTFQMHEFREHDLLSHIPLEGHIMDLEGYRDEVQLVSRVARLRERLDVRIGLEVDFIPEKNAAIQDILRPQTWDYLIGSVHDVDGLHYSELQEDIGRKNGEALWLRYLSLQREAVTSGCFQVISHPVRMYQSNPYLPATFDRELEDLAFEATRCNVALELNGFDVLHYPDIVHRLIEACVIQKTPISCGSDAHYPGEIGRANQQFESILTKADIQSIRTWRQQKPEDVQILKRGGPFGIPHRH
jgi:histidinol-phosphatase (PHP family)